MSKNAVFGACFVALSALLSVTIAQAANVTQSSFVRQTAVQNGSSDFVRVAGLFGESDEEKAARLQKEQNQDDTISRLNDRVRDLEDTLRNLTGQNETLAHRVQLLDDKLERQRKDFEFRLCTITAQQMGASVGQGDPNAIPCSGGSSSSTQSGIDSDASHIGPSPPHLAPGPGVLGTLSGGGTVGTIASPAPAPGSTQSEFSAAMSLLAKGRNDDASGAFRGFADMHPKDALAPQAVFWVGDIAYVQKDYGNAMRAFAEVIKKYPTSSRAPDSMLKLGQALIASGQKKEGCTALAALPAKYPHASASVLSQGRDVRKAVCRGIS